MWTEMRKEMVKEQILARGVTDAKVLRAMEKVERHLFVPEEMTEDAYSDHPLPIGYGQTISQPYIVAYMTEQAKISSGDKVLEIGTGSGYQAAVLAEIAEKVYTIELIEPLASRAEILLERLGYDNIIVRTGDGYQGWAEYAPFDAIVITAAPPEIPVGLIGQLKIGGRMIVPVGIGSQELRRIVRTEDGYESTPLLAVRFVPMVRERDREK